MAQPKIVNATQEAWAGGTCCFAGTKYRITIAGSKDAIEHIQLDSIVYHGRVFKAPQVTKIIQAADSSSYLFSEFNLIYSRTINEKFVDQLIEKPVKMEEGIFYTLHGVHTKLIMGQFNELGIIHYP